jgi:hypothetical protein
MHVEKDWLERANRDLGPPPVELGGLATTSDYDHHHYGLFKRALDAVSLGMGIGAPPLFVVELEHTNSFNTDFSDGEAVAVTPSLLSADLAEAEVEAVMAVAAAKNVYCARGYLPGRLGSEAPLGLGEPLGIERKELRRKWGGSVAIDTYALLLREDTLAARTTGQPSALISAIRKVASLLEHSPVRLKLTPTLCLEGYGVPPKSIFVSPPVSRWNTYYTPKGRDETIRLRLENLAAIEAALRTPDEIIRNGKPLVEPQEWK